MRKIVAFTGTRKGMTLEQKATVKRLLQELNPKWVLHGGCHGADGDLHEIASELGLYIRVHPGDLEQYNRYSPLVEVVCPIEPYLTRNRTMVDEATDVIGCPASGKEETRGGTWSTVRYARKSPDTTVRVVLPDGVILFEGMPSSMDGSTHGGKRF